MQLIIDLEGYHKGDRYKVYLSEKDKDLRENIINAENIQIRVKRGLSIGAEYIDLESILEYVFIVKELREVLSRFLSIENKIIP